MSKYTPGPWKWADGYHGLKNRELDEDILRYADYEGLWPHEPCTFEGKQTKAANCRLIRSAPRLVEALRGMVEAYELEASADNPALLEARAAYEEATGEKLEPPF